MTKKRLSTLLFLALNLSLFGQKTESLFFFSYSLFLENCQCGTTLDSYDYSDSLVSLHIHFAGGNQNADSFYVNPNEAFPELIRISKFLERNQNKLYPGDGKLNLYQWLSSSPSITKDFYLIQCSSKLEKTRGRYYYHNYSNKPSVKWWRKNWLFRYRLHHKCLRVQKEMTVWFRQQLAVHGYI